MGSSAKTIDLLWCWVGWNPASNSEGTEDFFVRGVQGRGGPLKASARLAHLAQPPVLFPRAFTVIPPVFDAYDYHSFVLVTPIALFVGQ